MRKERDERPRARVSNPYTVDRAVVHTITREHDQRAALKRAGEIYRGTVPGTIGEAAELIRIANGDITERTRGLGTQRQFRKYYVAPPSFSN